MSGIGRGVNDGGGPQCLHLMLVWSSAPDRVINAMPKGFQLCNKVQEHVKPENPIGLLIKRKSGKLFVGSICILQRDGS